MAFYLLLAASIAVLVYSGIKHHHHTNRKGFLKHPLRNQRHR
ncbi:MULTISPECIES: hypothetical protein [unclassified Erwinia]|nr:MULTISPECIES: hypothetical protein [unclassified Erwinia]